MLRRAFRGLVGLAFIAAICALILLFLQPRTQSVVTQTIEYELVETSEGWKAEPFYRAPSDVRRAPPDLTHSASVRVAEDRFGLVGYSRTLMRPTMIGAIRVRPSVEIDFYAGSCGVAEWPAVYAAKEGAERARIEQAFGVPMGRASGSADRTEGMLRAVERQLAVTDPAAAAAVVRGGKGPWRVAVAGSLITAALFAFTITMTVVPERLQQWRRKRSRVDLSRRRA